MFGNQQNKLSDHNYVRTDKRGKYIFTSFKSLSIDRRVHFFLLFSSCSHLIAHPSTSSNFPASFFQTNISIFNQTLISKNYKGYNERKESWNSRKHVKNLPPRQGSNPDLPTLSGSSAITRNATKLMTSVFSSSWTRYHEHSIARRSK